MAPMCSKSRAQTSATFLTSKWMGNIGKYATELDLKSPEGRRIFEDLLAEADIFVDGYRAGVLEKLGYGTKELVKWRRSAERV